MDDNEIKRMRKKIFHQIKIAEDRSESASSLIETETYVDAIPILFKAVDITSRTLLAFKQKPIADYQKNIKSLEEEYRIEGLWDEETIGLFRSLYEMNENYKSEIELEYDESAVKSIFEKTEDFLDKTHKFLKTQLTTSRERIIKRRVKKIFIASCISVVSLLVVFFLVKLGINLFGPKHGLLAHYYNNINLKGPVTVEKIDKKIDFVWGNSSPQKNIYGEFSVRWEGRIKIDKSDKYTFYILSDEGFRLFIDDKIIINTWSNQNRTMENSGDVKLERGFHRIRLEYYFNQKFSDIKLLWSSRSFKKRVVGDKVLFPPPELNVSR